LNIDITEGQAHWIKCKKIKEKKKKKKNGV